MTLRDRLESLGHVAPSGTLAPAPKPPVDLSRPGDGTVRRRINKRERQAHIMCVLQLAHDRDNIRFNSKLSSKALV